MNLSSLIGDLASILGVAAVVTFIFRRIKQPVVLGYILAGLIVGPHTPPIFSVHDTQGVKIWAELGVIFLMFALGLEFSFRRLARVGTSAGLTAGFELTFMLIAGFVTAKMLQLPSKDMIFLSCMMAISSTTIIIKTFEERSLKSKKFAEIVFGILIVEDLAAILILVGLTNLATTSEIGAFELFLAGGRLLVAVGVWFVVGMFLVPRFIRSVATHGNDEMLTVVALGLCLAMVSLAAYFHYSVALGAFVMGSILAESSESKRISHLVQPFKDIFGAVFFVSVGMLLDPVSISQNYIPIAIISLVVIFGKLVAVTIGALLTGQSIKTSVQTGFSMGQIGEFSFIIASLGLSYNVISEALYPIVVATSLITTFTTPFLVKHSHTCAVYLESRLPPSIMKILQGYGAWTQRLNIKSERRKVFKQGLIKWIVNAFLVITIFVVSDKKVTPLLSQRFSNDDVSIATAWLLAMVFSAPSVWAMLTSFRDLEATHAGRRGRPRGGVRIASIFAAFLLLGLLSAEFYPTEIAFTVTGVLCAIGLFVFKRRLEGYYQWMERQFHSGFQGDISGRFSSAKFEQLVVWDARLSEVVAGPRSCIVGKSLADLKLREKFGINIVVILRELQTIISPYPTEVLFPNDRMLCFGAESEVERFRSEVDKLSPDRFGVDQPQSYGLRRVLITPGSALKDLSIRTAGIREKFSCTVVGIQREGTKIVNPHSDLNIFANDVLWVVGEDENLQKFIDQVG